MYPKPKTTTANKEHYKYPYLLKDFRNDAGQIVIDRSNKVWSTDITYIKLEKGFVYLAAIIDWHSKKILSWKLSNTMDVSLTTSVLNETLTRYPKPEIFNTDQGSQYTSKVHTGILKNMASKSLWMVKAELQIIFVLNDSGEVSNMKRFISMSTRT